MASADQEKKQILVTGAAGLLGSNFVLAAQSRYVVTALFGRNVLKFRGARSVQADLLSSEEISKLLRSTRPDRIVHFAAATNVDECEANPAYARNINVAATELLARLSGELKVPIVYMSTDSVFDGNVGGYREEDRPNPINVYAATKLEGERAIREYSFSHLIVRANIFGWNALPKRSLSEWILDRLEHGQQVPGFVDSVFAPLLVNTLSDAILQMMGKGAVGTFHMASPEAVSKYEFARRLARIFGYGDDRVERSNVSRTLKAPRPMNTWLRADRVAREFGISFPTIDQELYRFRTLRDSGFLEGLKSVYSNTI